MPAYPPAHRVSLPGGRWTQVEFYGGTILLTKRYVAEFGGVVNWRWYSAGLVPHWAGSFRDQACITLPPGFFTSLEFNPEGDTTFTISATC